MFEPYLRIRDNIIIEGEQLFSLPTTKLSEHPEPSDSYIHPEWTNGSNLPTGSSSGPSLYIEWILELDQIIDAFSSKPSTLDSNCCLDTEPFSPFWNPIASQLVSQFNSKLPRALSSILSPDIWPQLQLNLRRHLSILTEQIFWNEFNSRRPLGVMLTSYLDAENAPLGHQIPSKHFDQFIDDLNEDLFLELLGLYPILGFKLSIALRQWKTNLHTFLQRVVIDWNELAQLYELSSVPIISALLLDQSDNHNHGQSVFIFSTYGPDGRSPKQVVYKPKSLCLENQFAKFIKILNSIGASNDIAVARVLDKNSYGYSEYIRHKVALGADQTNQFYYNAGSVLAVVYLLGCTDCIYENFIASSTQLFLIDAETLFEPDRITIDSAISSELEDTIGESVLRTGMLPHWWWPPALTDPIDISALGVSVSDAISKAKWEHINTDAMKFNKEHYKFSRPKCIPTDTVSLHNPGSYVDFICRGLSNTLSTVLQNKHLFIGKDGFFPSLSNFSRRIVLRRTQKYYDVLSALLEPKSLISAHNQFSCLNSLLMMPSGSSYHDTLNLVSSIESQQLICLDVPYIQHDFKTSICLSSNEDLRDALKPIIRQGGFDAAFARINQLDPDHISLQEGLTRGSILSRFPPLQDLSYLSSDLSVLPKDSKLSPLPLSLSGSLNEFSVLCADQLLEMAIRSQSGQIGWMSLGDADPTLDHSLNNTNFQLVPETLFSGSLGISLFLLALSTDLSRSGSSRLSTYYRNAFISSFTPIYSKLCDFSVGDISEWWSSLPLGLVGSGGCLLSLSLFADLVRTSDSSFASSLDQLILKFVENLPVSVIESDLLLDINCGIAGLVAPLSRCHSSRTDELLQACASRLLAMQHKSGGWLLEPFSAPLTGFSHGAGGIAAALSRLYSHSPAPNILTSIRRAMRYEESCFDPPSANWKDFRNSESGLPPMTSWCHGAPGIALSRLSILHNCPDMFLFPELDVALSTSRSHKPRLDTVCCGSFGISAILSLSSLILESPDLQASADCLIQHSLKCANSTNKYRFTLDPNSRTVFPGLFSGLAGFGIVSLESLENKKLVGCILSGGLIDF